MGHIGVKGLRSAVDGLNFDDSTHSSCEVCARANIRRSPFPKYSSRRATHLLERIHTDICGPLPPSYGNFSYYILFVDCFSRFITLFLMKSRDEALSLFIQFKTTAETFCGQKIKTLRLDNAPELIHGQMEIYCKAHGIAFEKTVPDSPSQNGVRALQPDNLLHVSRYARRLQPPKLVLAVRCPNCRSHKTACPTLIPPCQYHPIPTMVLPSSQLISPSSFRD
jgi:Integrase core domain